MAAFFRRYIKPRSRFLPDVEASRAMMERLVRKPPRGTRATADRLGGVAGEWLTGRRSGEDVLLYFHGGAYAICSPGTHRQVTGAFARRGWRVFAPHYRLAPDNPYPAALDDAAAVYGALLERDVPPSRITLAGESAGGGLALALLVRLRDEGMPLPAAAALFSPWADLTLSGESLRLNDDAMFHPDHAAWLAQLYAGNADPRDPQMSPVFADFDGLPPLLVHVGQDELLRDDARCIAERAKVAGVPHILAEWPDVVHGWQLFPFFLPEARRSIDQASAFMAAACRDAPVRAEQDRSAPGFAAASG